MNAVVLATARGKAVLLITGGVFREVKDRRYDVGQRLTWEEERSGRPAHSLRRGLLIAACLVLLAASSFAVTKYVPWTVVRVALGEASIQYCLNALNEVLSAEADTGEGQALLETVSAEPYEPLQSAMERTFSAMQEETGADAPVLVEIAPRFGDGKRAEEAVEKAGRRMETPVTVEKKPWQVSGKPKDQPPGEQNPADERVEQNMQAPADPEQSVNHPNPDAQSLPGNPEAANQSPPSSGAEPAQQEPDEGKEQFQPFGAPQDPFENEKPPREISKSPPQATDQDLKANDFPQTQTDEFSAMNETGPQAKDPFAPVIQPQESDPSRRTDAASNGHEEPKPP